MNIKMVLKSGEVVTMEDASAITHIDRTVKLRSTKRMVSFAEREIKSIEMSLE